MHNYYADLRVLMSDLGELGLYYKIYSWSPIADSKIVNVHDTKTIAQCCTYSCTSDWLANTILLS